MTSRIILFAACFILISCGKKNAVPADLLQPPKMQLVFWDIIRADALTNQQQKTFTSPEAIAANVQLQKQVFAIHGVTREDFYRSLDFYKAHPAIMKVMMDSMVVKANREKVTIAPINPALIK